MSTTTPWQWPESRISRVIDGDSLTATLTKRNDLGFYPGAGATHGPNITFAYVAASHLAADEDQRARARPPVAAAFA